MACHVDHTLFLCIVLAPASLAARTRFLQSTPRPDVRRPQRRCPGQHWLHALQKSMVVWLAAGSGVREAACKGALAGEMCPALSVSPPEELKLCCHCACTVIRFPVPQMVVIENVRRSKAEKEYGNRQEADGKRKHSAAGRPLRSHGFPSVRCIK